jgi:light-regulated signal transduction histidine kinase (bacteriophytochrome)
MAALSCIIALYYFLKARKLQQDNYAQAMIVRKIIHEVRDPLNGVLGYSEMLYSGYYGSVGPLQQGVVEDIINCAKKVSAFIKECNFFLLNKAGRLYFEWSRINLKNLIESLVKAHQKDFDNNKNQVNLRLVEKSIVIADKGKLLVALDSIIHHISIKSKPQNEITVIMQETRSCVYITFTFWPHENFNNKLDSLSITLCKMIIEMHKGSLALKITDDGFANLQIMLYKKKQV